MMGPTHAVCGSAVWLGFAPAAAQLAGYSLNPYQTLCGAAVSAGFALWPDLAKPGSTIARSFGPLTEIIAHALNGLAVTVYFATKTDKDNPTPTDAHRKLTHTLVWAIASAMAVTPLVAWGGKNAALGLMFFALGLGIRGLMHEWAQKQGWLGVMVAAAVATALTARVMPAGNYWWLAMAVFLGTLSHSGFGDLVTKRGTPLVWPLVINGKRWYDVAPPAFLRIETGQLVEKLFYLPLFTILTAAGVLAAFTGWGQVWEATMAAIQTLRN